ncbi:hypothetical protein [Vibrio cyclitrophicus]|uniref:Uncharacterized protein n=1 Tax=Vibrio cyclitrophicus TaxID=47951 RepID=A0ACD5G4S8_9VIBR
MSQNKMVKCKHCQALVKQKNMLKHISKTHKTRSIPTVAKIVNKSHAIQKVETIVNFNAFKNKLSLIKHLGLNGQLRLNKKEKHAFDQLIIVIHSTNDITHLKGCLINILNSIDFDKAHKRYLANVARKKELKRKKAKQSLLPKKRKKSHLEPLMTKKPDIEDVLNSRRDLPVVGLGTTPSTSIQKVRASEVLIDRHTTPDKIKDKHILYAEGWSLEGAFSK